MSAEKVDAYFNKQAGAEKDIALALRVLIDTEGMNLTCGLAWNFPCWTGNERILSIIPHKDRCNLQLFNGNRLAPKFPDLIEGTGKQMRHVKVKSVAEVNDKLSELIRAAIHLDATDPEKVR